MSTEECYDAITKVDMLTRLLDNGEMERVLKRAEEIETYFNRFETLDKLVTYMRLLERKAYVLKDYFTVDEVADYLGVSKSRVYKMTSAHVIDYYKPSGKTIYISRSDLNDWICGTRIASDEEIRTEAWRKAVRYNLDHPYVFNRPKRRTSG